MLFAYVAVFTFEEGSYWVRFPDIPGCFSQGDTPKEALFNAQEALALHLEPNNNTTPNYSAATDIRDIAPPQDGFLSYVTVDIDLSYSCKSVEKTLSIPEWLNNKAMNNNINLEEALFNKLYF